jgi:hypothetical protein
LSAHDNALGYVPRIRTDILLEDEHVDEVLATLRSEAANLKGHNFYWASEAEKGGQL